MSSDPWLPSWVEGPDRDARRRRRARPVGRTRQGARVGAWVPSAGRPELLPVNGFWSLARYNEHHDEHHLLELNDLGRYALGTENKDLRGRRSRRSSDFEEAAAERVERCPRSAVGGEHDDRAAGSGVVGRGSV